MIASIMNVVKPNPMQLLQPITKNAKKTISQSRRLRNSKQTPVLSAGKRVREDATVLDVTFYWLRKWHEFFNQRGAGRATSKQTYNHSSLYRSILLTSNGIRNRQPTYSIFQTHFEAVFPEMFFKTTECRF